MLNIIEYNNNNPIYVLADIHGDFSVIEKLIENYDNCLILIAGDIGVGFRDNDYYFQKFERLNNLLLYKHILLLMIRGNHDNPIYFKNNFINYSNLKLIEDYSVISIIDKDNNNNFNILCIGGAISIDRLYRISTYNSNINNLKEFYMLDSFLDEESALKLAKEKIKLSYFDNEQPIFDFDKLEELKNNNININHVITHSCPSFCFPRDKNNIQYWIKNDNNLENDLNNERETMSMIYQKLIDDKHDLNGWTYGHFHVHISDEINGRRFTALDNADKRLDIIKIK